MNLPLAVVLAALCSAEPNIDFERDVRPIFARHCTACHGKLRSEAGLRLDVRKHALKGGDGGPVLLAADGKVGELLRRVTTEDRDERMPPEGPGLSADEIERIRRWLEQGASWPEGDADRAAEQDRRRDHWAWKPLAKPDVPPATTAAEQAWIRTPVDAFIAAQHRELGLHPTGEASRRDLLRRVSFDLVGLPPTPEEIDRFVADDDPQAYEKLVDRLLASRHYGERWARHWLDVVHYADTHGYDKDKPRPNAWPYRDYVIRALNEDKPYARFVAEQIAGDVLFPGTRDGVEALGFLSAGPWDFIGHAEVPETKTDGKIARLLDRDDMASTTMNVFASLTVQCARCHDHKFDPVSQADYYSLQAVFAAIDRTDKSYDVDPATAEARRRLSTESARAEKRLAAVREEIARAAGPNLAELDRRIAELDRPRPGPNLAAYGYHSSISPIQTSTKWVQIDLGRPTSLSKVVLHPCFDNYNNIGAGFGFPVRFRVELSDVANFASDVTTVADYTTDDFANPKLQPLETAFAAQSARYVRVTAVKLAPRKNDFIFALAELEAFDGEGRNVAGEAKVSALDSIEAPPRWRTANLIDRTAPGLAAGREPEELANLRRRRERLLDEAITPAVRQAQDEARRTVADLTKRLSALPAQQRVYAGTVHTGSGNFRGTGPDGGRPRPIHVLRRGDVNNPAEEVGPGTVALVDGLPSRFELPADAPEGERRAALARWLVDPRNPIVWRTIVNRVWQYHFGRGLVETANDFGQMGRRPSHPELLDWLAFQMSKGTDSAGASPPFSLKSLHRLIVTSAVYRQATSGDSQNRLRDAENAYLWRMNRRRLEAEAVRDSVLFVAGVLDDTAGGPGYQDFVIEHPAHSPHYEYHLHDPADPKSHRRSIYRFIVRSQPQPFMTTLDCADPSLSVDRRNESQTALQALALLNNRFMLWSAERFAERLAARDGELSQRIDFAFRATLGRSPTTDERREFTEFAKQQGLAAACRVLFNSSEFMFVE